MYGHDGEGPASSLYIGTTVPMKFGTQVYCTKIYLTNQQLQVCKQQQKVSGNKQLYTKLAPISCFRYVI